MFHALPISRGNSVFNSRWIQDMAEFYGPGLFLAETSTTSGGLDSLLQPRGPLREAQDSASRAFGAEESFFVTNGTSTGQQDRRPGAGQAGRHRAGGPRLPQVAPLRPGARWSAALLPRPLSGRALRDLWGGDHSPAQARAARSASARHARAGAAADPHQLHLRRAGAGTPCGSWRRRSPSSPTSGFLWDEAWWAHAVCAPTYRRRTAMHAARTLARSLGDQRGSRTRGSTGAMTPRCWRPGCDPTQADAGARLRDPVDAQVALRAAAGIDDPRVRPGVRRACSGLVLRRRT